MRRWGSILALLVLIGIAGWGGQPPPLPIPPFQEVTVCPEGPPKCDFTSIEAAIGIVTGGGVIEVLPGVYRENIEIGKGLTLQGTVGVTIIAKDPEQSVIYVNPGVENVTITNLMITGSNKAGIEIGEGAKGIAIEGNWISGGEPGIDGLMGLTVQIKPHAQVIVEGNTSVGTYILIDAAKVDIIDNVFLSPLAIGVRGGEVKVLRNMIYGGILIEGDSLTPVSANIEDNIIESILRGLEIRTGEWGVVRLRRNILAGNTLGGVIWVRSLEAQGNYIINSDNSNARQEGQGLIVLATEKIDLVGNVVMGNDASGLILGLSQSGEMRVENNIILNNGRYGLALLNPDCIHTYVTELLESIIPKEEWDEIEDKFYQGQLQGEVKGSDNLIAGNEEGDLCPEAYPWPEGFVREEG